jgi:hypothetical protein
MGKYEPLSAFLRAQGRDQVPMTFGQIERVLGAKLPPSKQHRAWWSNNPDNNVMTRAWLEAGYETEAVDVRGGKLVFRRKKSKQRAARRKGRHPMFGCMKGMLTIQEGYDLTSPMELEEGWDKKYEP